MAQDVIHLLYGPAIRSHKAVLRKGLLLMLMVILSGGADATNVGDVLSGSSVYINVGTGYEHTEWQARSLLITVRPIRLVHLLNSVLQLGSVFSALTSC